MYRQERRRRTIFVLPKSPVPLKGRYGPRRLQDWYRACVIAARMLERHPEDHILVVTAFRTPDGTEEEHYRAAFAELGVRDDKLTVIARGLETVEEIEMAASFAHKRGDELMIVFTFTHGLRVPFLCAWRHVKARGYAAWGLPRLMDLIVDPVLGLYFPLFCFFGSDRAFLNNLKRKRRAGEL